MLIKKNIFGETLACAVNTCQLVQQCLVSVYVCVRFIVCNAAAQVQDRHSFEVQ